MTSRINIALNKLNSKGIECGILLKPENIYYLTDFFPTSKAALILKENPILLVSRMDYQLAEESEVEVEVTENFGDKLNLKVKKVAVEKKYASIEFCEKHLKDKKIYDLNFIQEMRKLKDKGEIKTIKRAARITEGVIKTVEGELNGKLEREIAALAEYKIREKTELAFNAIVASDENSAIPHHQPGGKKITGKVIILDIGAKVNGYHSDITRTFFLDKEPELYPIVLEAQKAGIKECYAGNNVKNVDLATRKVIREHGYEDYFLHSTGHGIGLEIHEPPILHKKIDGTLEKGMVVTVEPGIYKDYGVRMEDMILVGSKAKLLTRMKKC
tara:strand:+ start:1098 stop:2084 length:987 start_codon:yes stop_codon:yes gene_type:complete